MSALSSYRLLLSLPGARAFSVPACLARLGVAMQSLALLWAVHGASGSFVLAGLCTGAFAIAESLLAPQAARFVDSHGQRAVARVQLPAFALAATTVLVANALDGPPWLWLLASGVAGVACPQIGSLAAARWRHLTGGSAQMTTALALEAALNELTFMVGPVLVTTLAAAVHPSAGLALASALVLGATTALIRRRDTEPPRQPRGPGLLWDSRWLDRSLLPFAALHLLLGTWFGGATICLTAMAIDLGAGAYAGVIAAGGGAASLLVGIAYGGTRRLGARQALVGGAAVLALSSALLSQTHSLVPLVLLTVTAGACIAPIVIPAATALQQSTSRSLYVQAVTWTGSASALGSAASAPLVGRLVDGSSAQAGYLALAGLDLLLLVAAACVPMIDGGRRARPAPDNPVTPSP